MYQRILVPLDGSELAECVFPHLEAIAKGCRAGKAILVRVVEPARLPYLGEYPVRAEELEQIDAENRAEATNYLSQAAGRLKLGKSEVQTEVLYGKAAESLVDYAAKNEVDLIIMTTHGRSGISRWVWGSVAGRVLRSARAPVLVVRAPGVLPES